MTGIAAPASGRMQHGLLLAQHGRGGPRPSSHRLSPIRPRQRLGEVQPRADAQNAYLANHSWDEYAEWHLGLTDGVADQTKARYAFVYGDLRRVHRTGLIACVYRASEWRHKDIELAAHDLLQHLDRTTA
jgi:hypothetical protein